MIDGVDVIIFGKIREKENGEKIFPISNFKYKKYGKKEIIDAFIGYLRQNNLLNE